MSELADVGLITVRCRMRPQAIAQFRPRVQAHAAGDVRRPFQFHPHAEQAAALQGHVRAREALPRHDVDLAGRR